MKKAELRCQKDGDGRWERWFTLVHSFSQSLHSFAESKNSILI